LIFYYISKKYKLKRIYTMNIYEEALKLHEDHQGKIEVASKSEVKDMHDLAVVYTPGVAEPCRKIHEKTS
jgi:malate dehydrogenase (oxaloacetate-decarboxylating)